MMQLGAEAIFVGSGIFMKERATPLDVENDPKEREEAVSRARAIVQATTHFNDPKILAEVSEQVTGTMKGLAAAALEESQLLQTQRSLGLLDAVVERNAYGRQIDSTILTAETALPGGPLEMVFIRAPRWLKPGRRSRCWRGGMGLPCWCARARCWRPPFIPSSPPTAGCIGCLSRRSARPGENNRAPENGTPDRPDFFSVERRS
jgi:hypothetical protein